MGRAGIVGALLLLAAESAGADRLKDLADLSGVRANKLLGYGLVVGLGGTGDDATAEFTVQSVVTILRHLGVQVEPQHLRLRNVAAVVVTADLPAFAKPGQRVDVLVSSVGNARSLENGTLLTTPLKGPDLKVYALAQGPLTVGGYAVTGATGSRSQKNQTNVGRIPGGGLVERAVAVPLGGERMVITLRQPDFTTAARIAQAINVKLAPAAALPPPPASDASGEGAAPEAEVAPAEASAAETQVSKATAVDAGSVVVDVSPAFAERFTELWADLELLEVEPDLPTRVVVNERTGTVVLGDRVRLLPVAIAHGGLTLEVRELLLPSQPGPLSGGTTEVVPASSASAQEGRGQLAALSGASLKDVVGALNSLGVTPRDLVAILQALKSAGALRAELEVQ